MDEAQLQRLLAGEAGTDKRDGHGIGNKLVRFECTRNGFTLGARSEKGKGTSIWFDVALATAGARGRCGPPGLRYARRGPKDVGGVRIGLNRGAIGHVERYGAAL